MALRPSISLKARIPVLFHEQGFKIRQICEILGVKKSLVYKVLGLFRNYGTVYDPHTRRHYCPRILTPGDIALVKNILDNRHCVYLDEIQEQLAVQRGV
ncbi:hypothetical protein GGX14DRAFT_296297, partial [Mycena pura]